jgi:5-methylcytosine-specific restriction endonuclease McrA
MVRTYDRFGIIQLDEVISAVAQGRPIKFRGVVCHTGGNRLLTYHTHGVHCCVPGCKAHGQYFAVERAYDPNSQYHLNLYYKADEWQEIMMTSDHKIPKSLGGPDLITNRQPMCYPHNTQKGNKLIYT